ncbi:MAG: hypothetical protein LBU14_06750 [Candidatus Peribacteria bacterium]|nr:hypothetical protein [Candidatus Peribacteria bacterium]
MNSIGQDSNLTGIKTICLDETLENATCSIEDSALTFIKDSTNTDFQIRSYTP